MNGLKATIVIESDEFSIMIVKEMIEEEFMNNDSSVEYYNNDKTIIFRANRTTGHFNPDTYYTCRKLFKKIYNVVPEGHKLYIWFYCPANKYLECDVCKMHDCDGNCKNSFNFLKENIIP